MNIEVIKEFVKKKHKNQKRKQGTPFYNHPFSVAQMLKDKGFDINYQLAGLFHDLLEDTDTSYEEIVELSNESVAQAVKLLTKTEGYNNEVYLEAIKNNDMALNVKLADRINNLSESHLCSFEVFQKYTEETRKYYLLLAKGTVFEKDLTEMLEKNR